MSSTITTELVKELRDSTGISIMQCKHALEEADGDTKKALAILKKTSSDIAIKKMSREAKNGAILVRTEQTANGEKAVLVSLHCETDFVSKNKDFVDLLTQLTDKAFQEGIEAMKTTAKENIDPIIQKTGENIILGDAYELFGNVLGSYVHNGKSAAIVSLEGGNVELARDIAMHIVAMKPEYMNKEEISEEEKKTMTEIFEKEISKIEKPAEIKQKILEGKISNYFKERTLLDQVFIKNTDDDANQTIDKLLEKSGAKIKEIKRYSI